MGQWSLVDLGCFFGFSFLIKQKISLVIFAHFKSKKYAPTQAL